MKILLLEDNISLNKAITKVLTLSSYSVDSFTDGADLLPILDNHLYSLYILDINVPNISGLKLLKLIKESNPAANVIMITSNNDLNSLTLSYELGCIDFIKKPFFIEELKIKIDKLNIQDIDIYFKENNYTKKEYILFKLLLDNRQNIVSYSKIEDIVYTEKNMSMDSLRAMIKRVKSKLKNKDIIKNIQGRGYIIDL